MSASLSPFARRPMAVLLVGIGLSGPALVLLLLSLSAGIRWSGWGYTAALWMMIAGMIATHWRKYWSGLLSWTGVGLFCVFAVCRLLSADGGVGVRISSAPGGEERVLGRLFDERDANATAMVLMGAVGGTSKAEMAEFLPALHQLYDDMDRSVGPIGSPFLNSILGRQTRRGWDVVEVGGGKDFGVVFLHGASGNITAYCWTVGDVIADLGGQTICPSVTVAGHWKTEFGEVVVEEAISRLRAKGVQKIYLAGLSAGAVGVSKLAEQFSEGVEGLVLIAGSGAAVPCGVPSLVIAGENDDRFPLDYMRDARSACAQSKLVVLPAADHFLIVKERDAVQKTLRHWFLEDDRELVSDPPK